MCHPLRLNNKDFYINDLDVIRDAVKNNGNEDRCQSIVLSHSEGIEITLHLNFALEQNSKNPPKKASLVILGFTTKNHYEFRFDTHNIPCQNPAKEIYQLDIDGSYKSLGYTTDLPSITDANLLKSIKILNKIGGNRKLHPTELDAIARLTIATSEAIKFKNIANSIADLFGNDTVYVPNPFRIIGWGGRSIAS